MKKTLATILMLITQIVQSAATFSEPDQDKDSQEDRPPTPLLYAGRPAAKQATLRLLAAQQSQKVTHDAEMIDLSSADPHASPKKPSFWHGCCCLFFIRKRASQDSGLPITPNTSSSSMGSYGEE